MKYISIEQKKLAQIWAQTQIYAKKHIFFLYCYKATAYTKSARPPTSVSTSLAMLLTSGAWWSYSIELVARPLVMVRRAVT